MPKFGFFHTESPDIWFNSQQMQVRKAAARRIRPARVPCMAGLAHAGAVLSAPRVVTNMTGILDAVM